MWREFTMETTRTFKLDYGTIAWGALFVWWGIAEMFRFLPAATLWGNGVALIGVALILLGVNAARLLNGIPTRRGTTVVGILALVWGVLELAGSFLSLPFELPTFAILLITLGVLLFAGELPLGRAEPQVGA
jgi:hypothetical protein